MEFTSSSCPVVDLTDRIDRDSSIQVDGGTFSNVFKCRLRDSSGSSALVAVKVPRYFRSENCEEDQRKLDKIQKDLRRELGILKRLKHENIVSLLGVAVSFGPTLAAVFPWIPNGTLHTFLKNRTLSVPERIQLVHGIGSGLDYLHSKDMFHGDLHSCNVLIDKEHRPLISDFGLACAVKKLQSGLTYLERRTNHPGAARSAAPERLKGNPGEPHPSADIYSFGCIMFEVLSGDVPWKEMNGNEVIVMKLTAHKPPNRPDHAVVTEQHWALMVKCWSSAGQRPTAHEAVVAVHTSCFVKDMAKTIRVLSPPDLTVTCDKIPVQAGSFYCGYPWAAAGAWGSQSYMLAGDEFDMSAIPPVEIGIPGCGVLSPPDLTATCDEISVQAGSFCGGPMEFAYPPSWEAASAWGSQSHMLAGDEFDMSAIPPVGIGIPGCGDKILPSESFNIGYSTGPYDPMVIEAKPYSTDSQNQDTFEQLFNFESMLAAHHGY